MPFELMLELKTFVHSALVLQTMAFGFPFSAQHSSLADRS
jgi:hypothetical protein